MSQSHTPRYTTWLTDVSNTDVALVGGKNASLGEMVRELTPKGVRVPEGFAVTVAAYRRHLAANRLEATLHDILDGLDTRDVADLQRRAERARRVILDAPLPDDVQGEIASAYAKLCSLAGRTVDVAVRSSATAEDLPDASFAGQQDTFLNVTGKPALLEAVRQCFASLFTDRALSYRVDKGFDHFKVGLSVGVQRMVRSDLAAAGVMFTLDTETGFRDVVLINAAYGLGETVVQGAVNPDEFCVFKPTLADGKRPILRRRVGSKELKTIYDEGGGRRTLTVPVPADERVRLSLSDEDVLSLARWAVTIERHYSEKRGAPTPMDIEWAKDGLTGELYVVQARPETVESRKTGALLEIFELDAGVKAGAKLVTSGRAVGAKAATGTVRLVKDVRDLVRLREGDVLVAARTDPDWEPSMKLAAAIVTDRGGRTCHAAIVSRELGLPAVVGTESGTTALREGQVVTVSCAEGETGHVYDGVVPFRRRALELAELEPSFTDVMMILANPDEAFRLAQLPNDGVGLARMEFIINHAIKVHPMALVRYDTLAPDVRRKVDEATRGYDDKPGFFVDKLAEGVGTIAAAFYPKPVIVRLSDFKTNEYAHLLGGEGFEPTEENPMLGFRGAARYYDERYREGFALECRALWRVREEMGLTNVKIMVPFCRTVKEGEKVLAEMARYGLKRGENGLEVYVMCEIPSNVILAERFAEIFDGFSIGSNDLTQLVLGVDRDSESVAGLFDERDPAVLTMIKQAIDAARIAGRKIGICGQAPSDYPELALTLVRLGIDSISLNPDAIARTMRLVYEAEKFGGDR